MSDLTMARLARKHGCKACVYGVHKLDPHGAVKYVSCHFGAPRTSSNAPWPSVGPTMFCGNWMPATDDVVTGGG